MSMTLIIPDKLKELIVDSAIYGMLGQIYCTQTSLKEYRKKVKQLINRHQEVHKRLLNCISTFSEQSKANNLQLDKIRSDLARARRENRYQNNGKMSNNWLMCIEHRIAFKQNIIEECANIKQEILDCLKLIQRTAYEFDRSKGVDQAISSSIITSLAGLGGYTSAKDLFRTRGLFAFSGALMGTYIARCIYKCISYEESETKDLLKKMKEEMEFLLCRRKEFVLLISPIFQSLKSYEKMTLELFISFESSTNHQKVSMQTLKMLTETDILQFQLQRVPMQAKQKLRI
ncbi:unnamed protein product [Mucor hiemalis]